MRIKRDMKLPQCNDLYNEDKGGYETLGVNII